MSSFGARSIMLPPAVPFPREPMEGALAEHARLLHAHRREILDRVVDDEDLKQGMPFIGVDFMVAVVAVGRDGRSDVRGWCREDASWVLRRCHGLVQRMAQQPRMVSFYVAVVAGGVASLHLLKGTGEQPYEPGMTGTREGLGVKVVGRNLVVEPWDQWHARRDGVNGHVLEAARRGAPGVASRPKPSAACSK